MKVFLTGATGYIGSAIARTLQAAGHNVVGLARTTSTAQKLKRRHIEPFLGDLQSPERLAEAARQADGVIHTAFIHNFDDWAGSVQADCCVITAIAQALAGSGKPLITTSDTSVLGDTGLEIVDESHPIAEGFLLAQRAKAEQVTLRASQQDIRSIVLRLPLYIYGRGGGTSYIPMRLQEAEEIGVAQYVEAGENSVSAVHVDDVARLYLLALEKAPAGSLFHAAGESGITERAIASTIAQVVGCKAESISRDRAVLKWGATIADFFSINNQISASKAQQQLGWRAQATLTLLAELKLNADRTMPVFDRNGHAIFAR